MKWINWQQNILYFWFFILCAFNLHANDLLPFYKLPDSWNLQQLYNYHILSYTVRKGKYTIRNYKTTLDIWKIYHFKKKTKSIKNYCRNSTTKITLIIRFHCSVYVYLILFLTNQQSKLYIKVTLGTRKKLTLY